MATAILGGCFYIGRMMATTPITWGQIVAITVSLIMTVAYDLYLISKG